MATSAYAAEASAARQYWWVPLVEGIAAIIVGILLLADPGIATAVIVQVLGWYWLITGIIGVVMIFVDSSLWGWKLFGGLLGVLAGAVIINHPLWSTLLVPTTIVIILGIDGLLIGVVDIIKAFQGAGWGIAVIGVLSILFGIFLLSNAYVAALFVPWVFGVLAIVFGAAAVFMAFQLRKV